MVEQEYDLIIVGGGFAGYSAAIYAKRYNLKTLVIAKERGGLITQTHLVENYPGFISLTGQELADHLENHVKSNGVEIFDDNVSEIKKENNYFYVKTNFQNKEFKAKAIVLGTGTKHRHLDAPGEKELQGKGVSYCATCDGMFFRNKIVGIVGGSDSAAKEAMVLAQNSSKVYMFARSKLRAEPINADRIKATENIEVIENIQVKEVVGNPLVSKVILSDDKEIELQGLFIAIGMLPQNDLAKQLGCDLNKAGEVIIDKLSSTSIKGVFAAGDLTDMPFKQGIIGSAQGSAAGYSAFEYISNNF